MPKKKQEKPFLKIPPPAYCFINEPNPPQPSREFLIMLGVVLLFFLLLPYLPADAVNIGAPLFIAIWVLWLFMKWRNKRKKKG